VQEYGAAEVGQIAFNRGKEVFEVYSDLNYVECLLPPTTEPEAHPVLVTSLFPRYTPMIRYRAGDALLRPDRLLNGHVRRFGDVAGRINDVIKMDGGDSIHSVAIFHCIHQEPSVHNIQMLVRTDGIEIRLISTTPQDVKVAERIRRRLVQVHPSLAKARIVYADDLTTNRAGKRRWFVDERTNPGDTL
jgi:phenylacetate-coenzyme A ligase PaaK-like adenylate-forming protein